MKKCIDCVFLSKENGHRPWDSTERKAGIGSIISRTSECESLIWEGPLEEKALTTLINKRRDCEAYHAYSGNLDMTYPSIYRKLAEKADSNRHWVIVLLTATTLITALKPKWLNILANSLTTILYDCWINFLL